MPENPTAEALRLLLQRREIVEYELGKLNEAIASLENVPGLVAWTPPPAPVEDRPSVRSMMLALFEEVQRDWSVGEIIDEYARRGTPVHGENPDNALRAAINECLKTGRIERTDRGRYMSTLWRLGPEKGGLKLA